MKKSISVRLVSLLKLFCMCMGVWPPSLMYVYMPHAWPRRPEKSTGSPELELQTAESYVGDEFHLSSPVFFN